jgi:phosphoribosylformylglycinamidine synthase
MSAKGGVGMRIDLDKVPTRQKNMKAWELLLSESQERMLMVVEKGKEKEVMRVFEKWDLPCCEIGEVTDDGILKFYMHGILEAEIPAYELVLGGGAPQYTREYREPKYLKKINAFSPGDVDDIKDDIELRQIAEQIIRIPNIASKRWITVQYDSTVGAANASTNAPGDAAVVIAKGTGKALAMKTDCNSRYVFAHPYTGTMIAVAEAARNLVCTGAEPLGVTNCLNFGNPYDPEVYYQFVKAVEGMGEACKKFNTPVTGGNVSFYNQNPDGPVYPTPTIGMVGLIDSIEHRMTLDYKNAGDVIILVGEQQNDIASSEYVHKIRGVEYSPAPHFNLDEEYTIQKFVTTLITEKNIKSAHDISEGGLLVTLFESGFNRNLGFDVRDGISPFSSNGYKDEMRLDAYWFGEAQSRIVVTCSKQNEESIKHKAAAAGIPITVLGVVTNGDIKVNSKSWGNIKDWKEKYDTAIENILYHSEDVVIGDEQLNMQ